MIFNFKPSRCPECDKYPRIIISESVLNQIYCENGSCPLFGKATKHDLFSVMLANWNSFGDQYLESKKPKIKLGDVFRNKRCDVVYLVKDIKDHPAYLSQVYICEKISKPIEFRDLVTLEAKALQGMDFLFNIHEATPKARE